MKSGKSNLAFLADASGLFASCLCFLHCWTFPLLLIFLPELMPYDEMVHPVLSGIAIVSTAPMLLKRTFGLQSGLFQVALVFGNVMMLVILLLHEILPFQNELIISTLGGVSLLYVHSRNLQPLKNSRCNNGRLERCKYQEIGDD